MAGFIAGPDADEAADHAEQQAPAAQPVTVIEKAAHPTAYERADCQTGIYKQLHGRLHMLANFNADKDAACCADDAEQEAPQPNEKLMIDQATDKSTDNEAHDQPAQNRSARACY